jgi:hypothetical protein
MVGPYTGTVQQPTVALPSPPAPSSTGSSSDATGPVSQEGGYNVDIPSDSGFFTRGHAHFAVWGRQLAQDVGLIQSIVATYQPDYILLELGFNDMGWFISDAAGTLNSMTTFINNARAGKSDVAFVIANVPQRTFIGGRDDLITKTETYNAALPGLLDKMFTDTSPIYLAQFRENYECTL